MKTKFQFQGKDGKWHPLEEGSMQPLKIELPDTTPIDNGYKEFIDAFIEQKCFEAEIRFYNAQDDLALAFILNDDSFKN